MIVKRNTKKSKSLATENSYDYDEILEEGECGEQNIHMVIVGDPENPLIGRAWHFPKVIFPNADGF